MKYGKYIESKIKPEWSDFYIDYKGLKDLIKACQEEAQRGTGGVAFSPRTTSLTVQRYQSKDSGQEKFFKKLETDVEKVNKFTQRLVEDMRASLKAILSKTESEVDNSKKELLLKEAQRVGDDFLALEKYVNVNYLGFHKILKKHDKCLPHSPCRQFYVAHLHQQPWVQGNYSDLLVGLSQIYSKLRGDSSGEKNEDAAQGFVRSTTKYWVRNEDVSTVKHHVLQHLPVFQFDKNNFAGDAQLINSVYMDNSSMELYHGRLDKKPGAIALRVRWYGNAPPKMIFMERKTHRESWKGEESVKERFTLPDDKVVAFMDGEYTLEMALDDQETAAKKRGKTFSVEERDSYAQLFTETYKAIDSKQLKPLVRTQYMRTAFQIPFDATVRVSLDTNLCMIKENPEDGPSCAATGRYYRDPSLPVHRTEITRFPHAVLEVKLSLQEGQSSPAWVQELIDSGYLTEVHKFSKFIHGGATLFPQDVRAVPYWVDDESVRASMLASAPSPPEGSVAGTSEAGPASQVPRSGKPKAGKPAITAASSSTGPAATVHTLDSLTHPLLGEQPTLKLMPDPSQVKGFLQASRNSAATAGAVSGPGFFSRILGLAPPSTAILRSSPLKIEPKTFFANERTFLSWLHMAITLGSISAALLGFASGSPAAGPDPVAMSRHLVELIALILLPLGVCMSCYALYVFIWRASNIAQKRAVQFDDRVGPLCLCGLVVLALVAITLLSIIDFVEVMQAGPI
mmetsp:Transcript_27459/g.50674  ORF Transcript_27459/g.50674 Transcript_27459/m.50674 type:complete len:739 (-) Transcript_27459:23-2239(-)|eukprot:CAMPEP_0175087366 /NCGR_PEP_ID=MMETSP0052_2-20121109/29790_1 /TAXON_ID=51329 ORGANISM="Polytomella parva, Strain SAG 63-3" /NCGR_SAMPLE_ID=MMETSP0052_2 /ASSEMBLY_ACC=CAM_ASM_000194 /LENGTH=738 /DNA_ID=CAMNT_0016359703 /DNA_START=21 /DNA_END=2237 /DNA_ORIENTATION=-